MNQLTVDEQQQLLKEILDSLDVAHVLAVMVEHPLYQCACIRHLAKYYRGAR